MKLKITVGAHILVAQMNNNPTIRDSARLLPFTVKLDENAKIEQIFYPSRKLSVQGAPDAEFYRIQFKKSFDNKVNSR